MEGGVRAAVHYVTSGAESSELSVSESSVSFTRNDTFLSQAMPEPGLARVRPWVELWEGLGCSWESFGKVFGYKKSPCGHLLGDTELKKTKSAISGYKKAPAGTCMEIHNF